LSLTFFSETLCPLGDNFLASFSQALRLRNKGKNESDIFFYLIFENLGTWVSMDLLGQDPKRHISNKSEISV
jgi:hypothetical protein